MPWLPDALNFVMILWLNTTLTHETYFALGNAPLPFFLTIWAFGYTKLMFQKQRKKILTVMIAFTILFEILFFYFLFTDPNQIGTFITPFQVEFGLFIIIYLIIIILYNLITGVLFARISLRSKDPEVKLKGKFFLIAFFTFAIGAFLDSSIELTAITVIITRMILISSAIDFYFAFYLPEIFKKLFLKKEKKLIPSGLNGRSNNI